MFLYRLIVVESPTSRIWVCKSLKIFNFILHSSETLLLKEAQEACAAFQDPHKLGLHYQKHSLTAALLPVTCPCREW